MDGKNGNFDCGYDFQKEPRIGLGDVYPLKDSMAPRIVWW